MLGDRGFFGPAQYERFVLYLVVGVALLALVAAWYVFVVRYSRTRLPREVVAGPPAPADLRLLKVKYSSMIDEVEGEFQGGRLSERAVAARLSLLLRFFAFESSGVDAHVMTLSDLRRAPLPTVTGAVEQFYPPAFRQESHADGAESVRTAREVVRSWS